MACYTFTTNDTALAAHHQVHGAYVWMSDCLDPSRGNPRACNVRHAYTGTGSLLCNYCGFGTPCKH
ncbi:MAG: hypothetical protein C0607_02820 [Azoarcus sp.]|nr:MAG: hypothetical protein C0607_02820 [Azoarcus sp.]